MKSIDYSFIIPVYNRPDELEKLLKSLEKLNFERSFEVVIIEDGSTSKSDKVCSRFRESVNISYYFKPNSGPGDSRNYGMSRAQGDYFIILDSDCLIPENYLNEVDEFLKNDFVHCYGGPDAAHESFTDLQKAINYSMTSFLTTGGIRGGGEQLGKFQPRSFNMGLSKKAFEDTGGFGTIHPGEDPDLSIRLWQSGYETKLIKKAYVYHERRISWTLFKKQVEKFGKVRVILNKWHPQTSKLTFWFPSLFILGAMFSIVFSLLGYVELLLVYTAYFFLIFIDATIKNNISVGFKAVYATMVQFYGYGIGFLTSFIAIKILNKNEKEAFPKLFFK